MIRAGKLDHVINILRACTTPDDAGTPQETWETVFELRAERLDYVTDEQMRASGPSSEYTIAFRLRYVEGIKVGDRLTYAGDYANDTYTVKQIREIGRRRGLELRAERLGS